LYNTTSLLVRDWVRKKLTFDRISSHRIPNRDAAKDQSIGRDLVVAAAAVAMEGVVGHPVLLVFVEGAVLAANGEDRPVAGIAVGWNPIGSELVVASVVDPAAAHEDRMNLSEVAVARSQAGIALAVDSGPTAAADILVAVADSLAAEMGTLAAVDNLAERDFQGRVGRRIAPTMNIATAARWGPQTPIQ
jgi:hypothetical protein